ncbi:Dihydrolipoyllysine-residue acetyltransferase component of pyruvate dehydrogenase complex [Streptomyces griseorubiginosus]|uniref:Dihydrolipoamide acetyltransferase component of pyruvate dehydrogenase complex n=1 Tax=Streptomyces griseorubiginosus TaxID=67304 RepID=A0AAI8KUI2_9ACTN|nr:Dihydrolipoyllysine-residue acetyltransferase component of pyruvate dehydrogenase complex [Streptomyces griseorubiginosus]
MTDVAVEVLLPKIGLTMQEGTIDEWLVPTGAVVTEGEALLRLATDKVDVDVEAEAGGLFHPVVPAGTTVPAGALIGWLLAEGERPPEGAGEPAGAVTSTTTVAPPVDRVGDRLLSSPNARRVAAAADVDLTVVHGTGPGGRIVSEDVEDHIAALAAPAGRASSPLVRKLAKERGIDLSEVNGTGPGGRIRRADLDAALPVPETTAPARSTEVIPLTGMRGTIARRMHASLQEMAQLTHGYEVRMDAVVSLRDRLKEEWSDSDLPVPSINDFLLKAAALALREHPLLNATVRENGIHLLDDIHLGFAVAVPGGLMVPVIEDAAELSLTRIAERTRALAEAARTGRISPAQLEGATFTVTSLGGYGVDFFTPVINPGNVAILGVGRLKDGVEWTDDKPLRTRVLTLSLTFDHRAVDGAPAAEYLRTLSELLSRPLRLLV